MRPDLTSENIISQICNNANFNNLYLYLYLVIFIFWMGHILYYICGQMNQAVFSV